jgi:hypothetical protein
VEACLDDFVRSEVARLWTENSRAGVFLSEGAEADLSSAFTVRSGTVSNDLNKSESFLDRLPDLSHKDQ